MRHTLTHTTITDHGDASATAQTAGDEPWWNHLKSMPEEDAIKEMNQAIIWNIRQRYGYLNEKYFNGAIKCELIIHEEHPEDWGKGFGLRVACCTGYFNPEHPNYGPDTIEISLKALISTGRAPEQTLLHEMAHAKTWKEEQPSHGFYWLEEMIRLYSLGANISRKHLKQYGFIVSKKTGQKVHGCFDKFLNLDIDSNALYAYHLRDKQCIWYPDGEKRCKNKVLNNIIDPSCLCYLHKGGNHES